MPINPRIMPFTKHFIELRKRFIYVLIAFLLLLVLFYQDYFYELIMNILLGPIKDYIPGGQLTVLGPFETLTFRFKIAMYAAVIASSPVILYNIFAFIMPAIKQKERKWLVPTVVAAVVLFLMGVSFAYFVIMGPAFEWLYQQGAGVIGSIASANLYLSGIAMMLIGFGIAFELPLVVFYLIGWGVLPFDTILKSWRFAIVIIMIVAAIATPDWSPINMGGLSLALIVLYFGAMLAARVVFSNKIKQQRIEKAAYDAMYEEAEVDEEQALIARLLPDDFDRMSRTDQMIARAEAQQKAAAQG
jgi:sec-independent protein translocase protein TatC